jgi:hypothetical protein
VACEYTLSSIVMELAVRAGLDPRHINVSRLAGSVRGYVVVNTYPAVEALRALSQIFLFDATSYDGRIQFVHRGQNTVATITEDEMLDDDDQDIEQQKRADSITIPRVIHLSYFDIAGGLTPDKQSSERSGDRRAVGEMSIQTPILLSADEAAKAVAINHKVMIEDQKGELKFSLPDNYIRLTPADTIFVQWDGKTERARIAKIDVQDGYQEYTLIRDRQTAYVSTAEGYPASPQSLPSSNVPGVTLIQPLDIHIIEDVDDSLGFCYYVAITGPSEAWTGALVELSYDGGENYTQSQDVTIPTIMGNLTTELNTHPQAYPDVTNTCRVRIQLPGGELEETDLAGMLSGENLAIIGDEIVQFANAEEVEEDVWELSYFLRGRKGTAPAIHPIGTRFVMLDGLTPIPASVTDVGRTLTFRATSYGATVDTATIVSMTYTGRSQIEREVGYLEARLDGSNAIVTWQGIGRLGAGASVAHGARFAGYRVTYSDGVNAPIVVDTDDQSHTQNVSSLTPPITVSVVQLNDLTGAGPSTEVIIE